MRALGVARRSEALLRVAFAAIDAYEALKAQRAVLDYDDLIERTSELLHRPGKTEWVLYKLDARIDHVLVDEAQDTSPRQWAIVLKLTEEFFAGAGARDGAAIPVRGRRREAVDLQLPGCRPRQLPRACASG